MRKHSLIILVLSLILQLSVVKAEDYDALKEQARKQNDEYDYLLYKYTDLYAPIKAEEERLKKIYMIIPSGSTVIADGAFKEDYLIQTVTIPNSVTSIGKDAFLSCPHLKAVYINDLKSWLNIEFENEYSNPLASGAALYVNNVLIEDLIIPNGITTIRNYAFCGYKNLKTLTIPGSVTEIGLGAFSYNNIKEVYISDLKAWLNIKFDIDSYPLARGATLYVNNVLVEDLIIPEGITTIGDCAFYGCSSLTSVTIPDSVTTIGYRAFDRSSSSLTDIYFKGTKKQWKKINKGKYLQKGEIYIKGKYKSVELHFEK